MPKEGYHCIYLSVTLNDPVFKIDKIYYSQVCTLSKNPNKQIQ